MPSSPATDIRNSYGRVAIGLHWLIAFAILATFALGLYMHELPL
jgi:cytochrome b561